MEKIHAVLAKRFGSYPVKAMPERFSLYPLLAKSVQKFKGYFTLFDLFKVLSLIDLKLDYQRGSLIKEIQQFLDTDVLVYPTSKNLFGQRYVLK